MEQAGKIFYDSISNYGDLKKLVDDGEAENLFLECKSPTTPTLTQDLRKTLAKALSGFSNTNGGVILWGASTTNKSHSGLDVITQIEPIGNCKKFQREIENRIPTLSTPAIFNFENKIIRKSPSDTKGVLVTFIPKFYGDPVQSTVDDLFYFRSGDDFVKAPYEMIKRLFTATEGPDLTIEFDSRLVEIDSDNNWSFPLVLINDSSAVADKVKIFLIVENSIDCSYISVSGFKDVSKINPQFTKAMMCDLNEAIYKGLNINVGYVRTKLKGRKRKLIFTVSLYANKMITKNIQYKLSLTKGKFSSELVYENSKY